MRDTIKPSEVIVVTTKAQIMEKVESLPDTVDWDSVMNTLELLESLARADDDIDAGHIYGGDAARLRVHEIAKERYGSTVDR